MPGASLVPAVARCFAALTDLVGAAPRMGTGVARDARRRLVIPLVSARKAPKAPNRPAGASTITEEQPIT